MGKPQPNTWFTIISSRICFLHAALFSFAFFWTKTISQSEHSHRECQHHDIMKILGEMASFGKYIRHACILVCMHDVSWIEA